MAQHERHDLLRLVLVGERGGRAVIAFAPHLRQPFGWLDRFGSRDDRGEIAVEHLQVHAILGHRIGGEKRLELIELGFGQGFVEGAGVCHGLAFVGSRVGTR